MRLITYEEVELDSDRGDADPFWWDMVYGDFDNINRRFDIVMAANVTHGLEDIVGAEVNYQVLAGLIGEDYEKD